MSGKTFDITSDDNYLTMLSWMRRYRQRHHVTQAMVAATMGTTQGEVSKLERGITDPYPRTLLSYVRALGLLPEMYAVSGEDER